MKLYFLTSLSPPVQSCSVSQAIFSCVPLPYRSRMPIAPITCSSFSFSRFGKDCNGNLPPLLTNLLQNCITPPLWWESALTACLGRVPGDGCMHTHDVGRWEKALIPGRMTFCRTALCRDSYEGSNTEAKHWVSSSSMEAHGKHS